MHKKRFCQATERVDPAANNALVFLSHLTGVGCVRGVCVFAQVLPMPHGFPPARPADREKKHTKNVKFKSTKKRKRKVTEIDESHPRAASTEEFRRVRPELGIGGDNELANNGRTAR